MIRDNAKGESELRISKSETSTKYEGQKRCRVGERTRFGLLIWVIRVCFGFRASSFGGYAVQGRWRVVVAARTFRAMIASSRTWKSNMPAQMKSAPFSKAYWKPSCGWMAPAAMTL